MRFTLLFFLIFIVFQGNATEITGHQKEYAGRKLHFFKYTDPVTLEKEPVFTLDIDASGNFKADATIDETTFVFSEFGIYRGNLFLVPNQPVELLLPPLREKTFAERKNPYFSPLEFWIATKDGHHLNDRVSESDNLLNFLTDKYFNQLYFQQSKNAFDSVRIVLDKQFGMEQAGVLTQHISLRLKAVEADALRLSAGKIAPALSEIKSTDWNFPAFIQLFEKTFAGRLSFEAKSMKGNSIMEAIGRRDISFFKSFIKSRYGISGVFSDLVLLKLLHDGYYSGDFPQENILQILNDTHLTANQSQAIREITANVKAKLMHMRKGSKAPVICLADVNGKKYCTDETAKKFSYLIFADTEMVVVKEQLKYLTRVEELFGSHLQIVVVLLKTDIIEMKKFLIEEKIPGVHLVDANNEIIEKYKVKSFPTCYLLNDKHEVVFEDTKAPLDGFEQQFGTFLRQYLFRQQGSQK